MLKDGYIDVAQIHTTHVPNNRCYYKHPLFLKLRMALEDIMQ